MTDYTTSIREFDVSYSPVVDRDAGRETTDCEVALSTLSVTVKVGWRPDRTNAEREAQVFEVEFVADHDEDSIEYSSVGDAYDDSSRFDPERLQLAAGVAAEIVAAWLDDVGLAYARPAKRPAGGDADVTPMAHTGLDVVQESRP
jgi:hypothetical protein